MRGLGVDGAAYDLELGKNLATKDPQLQFALGQGLYLSRYVRDEEKP